MTAITTDPQLSLAQTPSTTLTETDSITATSISPTTSVSLTITPTISVTPTDSITTTISVSPTLNLAETNTDGDATCTHKIQVGAKGKLKFAPRKLDAQVGDILHFQFLAVNHTLTQSTLQNPCSPNGIFDTKFLHANPINRTDNKLTYLVQNSDPQYFYCAQTIPYSHCNAGMVFALNPGDTFKEFLSNAETSPTSAITASTGVSFPTATRVSAVSFPTATGVSGASSPTGVSGASMNNSIPLTIRIPPNPQTSSGAARKRAFLDQFY